MAIVRIIKREDGKLDLLVKKNRAREGITRLIRGVTRESLRDEVARNVAQVRSPESPVTPSG